MTQLSDEILIAYADRELGPEQVALIDRVFAADAHTLARFRQIEAAGQRLSGVFSSMLQAGVRQMAAEQMARERRTISQQPVASPEPAAPLPGKQAGQSRKAGSNKLFPAMAAGILMLVLGTAGGYLAGRSPGNETASLSKNFWNDEQVKTEQKRSKSLFQIGAPKTTATTPDRGGPARAAQGAPSKQRGKGKAGRKWYESLARRHQSEASRLLDHFSDKNRSRELALFELGNSSIAPAIIPALDDEQLVFAGAESLSIDKRPYVRLVYRDIGNGAVPIALYVGAANGGSLTLERSYMANHNYVHWTQGKYSYMLIGSVPHWRLIVLSVSVQRQLVR